MSNKTNGVVKLIGNKLFIALLVFALGIIMASAIFNSANKRVARSVQQELPVVSKAEALGAKEEVKAKAVTATPKEEKKEDTPKVQEVSYKMPLSGALQRGFSDEELLWDETMGDWRTHTGMDIESPLGTQVDTAGEGKVLKAYEDAMFGFSVEVQHPDGVVTVYKNLERVVVKEGDRLDIGQMIGTVGDKAGFEALQKPHLHFEVIKDGKNINPLDFIK